MQKLIGLGVTILFPFLANGQKYPVEYGSRLHVTSKAGLEKKFRASFEENTGPAGVTNCSQLVALHGREPQAKGNVDFQAESVLANCLAMDELLRASSARSSYLRTLPWDGHMLSFLPPQLTITASDEMTRKAVVFAGQGRSYLDFDSSAKATKKVSDELDVTGNDFSQTLIILGRGDFTGDGVEDMLIERTMPLPRVRTGRSDYFS